MNTPAIRYAARSITGWWLIACTAVYITLGAISGTWGNTLPWAALFFGIGCISFWWRYSDHGEKVRREAERAQADKEREERAVERDALMKQFETERLERELAKAQAIARGELCPDDCEGCREADERRQAEMKEWQAERARAHGHKPRTPLEIADSIERQLDDALQIIR